MRLRWIATAAGTIGLALSVIAAGPPLTGTITPFDALRITPGAWQRIDTRTLPPGAIKPAASRFAYGQACAIDIGQIPDYDCMAQGKPIPITKNGVALPASNTGNDCDNPVKLHMGLTGSDQCMVGSRLVDLSPKNNPDVTVMAICRRYHPMAAKSTMFNDLAMIAHNRKTGTTCFFQSPVDKAPGPFDGSHVPSPMSDTPLAKMYWLEPAGAPDNTYTAPGGISCTNCHDADPFILSPWINQVANLGEWDPRGKYFVDKAGLFSPLAGRPQVTAHIDAPNFANHAQTVKLQETLDTCFQCHRMGAASLGVVAGGPGGLTDASGQINFHGFMPQGDTSTVEAWPADYRNAVTAVQNCFQATASANRCHLQTAGVIK